MEVIEALRTSILEPRDHLHINQIRMFAVFCRMHGYAARQVYADGGTLISGRPGVQLTAHA